MNLLRSFGSCAIVSAMLLALAPASRAVVVLQIRESGGLDTSASVGPGGLLSLDVVAVSITPEAGTLGNLDALGYYLEFSSGDFTLVSDAFAAPFDNDIPAAGGNNSSLPWPSGSPITITDGADAGSPFFTPLTPDLYRATATIGLGQAVSGTDIVLETLTLQVPSPLPGDLPASYSIALVPLEFVDQLGSLHTAEGGVAFAVTVVPEPGAAAVAGGFALLAFVAARRWQSRARS
jgi:hypothetical protein